MRLFLFGIVHFEGIHKGGGVVSGYVARIVHELPVEWDRGFDPFDYEFIQRTFHLADGFLAGLRRCNEFGNHRIVIWRNRVPCVNVGVETNTVSAWSVERGDLPW